VTSLAARVPLGPRDPGPVRPDLALLPTRAVTRFAPAPTGHLHLGHLVNAIYVWGIARLTAGQVLLRIEDHDRQRSRPAHESAILRDLARLGLEPDAPLLRQSDDPAPYAAAVASLRARDRVYACDCARAALLAWRGPGCPGACAERAVLEDAPGVALRASVGAGEGGGEGAGEEAVDDLLAGRIAGDPTAAGDLTLRDRLGNWSYPLCAVADDARSGITLVIRGRDLLDATPTQVRLGRLLGRPAPPAYLHHPLLRKPSGAKLSKADGDTGIGELLDGGATPAELFGFAAAAVGLLAEPRPIEPSALASLFEA
jgi:glutamyl-Q tRNA(Asp) synthetase